MPIDIIKHLYIRIITYIEIRVYNVVTMIPRYWSMALQQSLFKVKNLYGEVWANLNLTHFF